MPQVNNYPTLGVQKETLFNKRQSKHYNRRQVGPGQ